MSRDCNTSKGIHESYYFINVTWRQRGDAVRTYIRAGRCVFCVSTGLRLCMFVHTCVICWYMCGFLSFLAINVCLFSFVWEPDRIFLFKSYENNITSRRGWLGRYWKTSVNYIILRVIYSTSIFHPTTRDHTGWTKSRYRS